MRGLKILGLLALAGSMACMSGRRAGSEGNPSAVAVLKVLDDQVAAWNRGDVDGFMQGYKDSAETTFIGKSIEHGYGPILQRYKAAYSSKEAMGRLDFSDLSVRLLTSGYAVVTGRFHLARNAQGGGDARGIFSLLWEKTPSGWKIILDHTSSIP